MKKGRERKRKRAKKGRKRKKGKRGENVWTGNNNKREMGTGKQAKRFVSDTMTSYYYRD
jgi:hypothetical protein